MNCELFVGESVMPCAIAHATLFANELRARKIGICSEMSVWHLMFSVQVSAIASLQA